MPHRDRRHAPTATAGTPPSRPLARLRRDAGLTPPAPHPSPGHRARGTHGTHGTGACGRSSKAHEPDRV